MLSRNSRYIPYIWVRVMITMTTDLALDTCPPSPQAGVFVMHFEKDLLSRVELWSPLAYPRVVSQLLLGTFIRRGQGRIIPCTGYISICVPYIEQHWRIGSVRRRDLPHVYAHPLIPDAAHDCFHSWPSAQQNTRTTFASI